MKKIIPLILLVMPVFFSGCYHSTGIDAPLSIISQVDDTNSADFITDSPKAMAAIGDYYISNNHFDMVVDGGIVGERKQNYLAPTGGSIIDITTITVNSLGQRNSYNNDNLNEIFQVVNANLGTPVAYTSIRIETLTDQSSTLLMDGFVMDRDGSLQAAGMQVDPETHLVPSLKVQTRYYIEKNSDFLVMTTVVQNTGSTSAPVSTVGDYVFLGGNSLRPFIPVPGYGYCPEGGISPQTPAYAPYVTFEESVAPYETFGMYSPDDGVLQVAFDSGDRAYKRSGGQYLIVSKPSHPGNTLAPGESVTFVRNLLPRLSPNQYTAAYYVINEMLALENPRNLFEETGRVSGVVNYNINQKNLIVTAEQILPGSYFNGYEIASSPVPVPFAATRTSDTGGFNLALPPGRYQLRIYGNGIENYVTTTYTKVDIGDPTVTGDETYTQLPIDITAGQSLNAGEISLYTPLPGHVEAISKNESGDIVASRVTIEATDGGAPVNFGDEEGGEFGGLNQYLLYYGDRKVTLRQGEFRFIFSHGFLYDIAKQDESITEGQDDTGNTIIVTTPDTIEVTLSKVVDPGKYISFDPTIRSSSSYNCSVNPIERVMEAYTDDVGVVMTTDTDVVADPRDYVKALEARYRIETNNGVDIDPNAVHVIKGTTVRNFMPGDLLPRGFGKLAVFPLAWKKGVKGFGVGETGDRRFATILDNIRNIQKTENKTLYSILLDPRGTDTLPNGMVSGLFTSMNMPVPATLNDPYFSKTSELGTGTKNGDFNVMEILAGNNYTHYLKVRADWFNILHEGRALVGCAGSGYAENIPHFVGSPRTFVHYTADSYDEDTFIQEFIAGHSFISTGPFLQVTAGDKLPGDTVAASNGTVSLNIKVQAPDWIPVNELRIVVDGTVVQTVDLSGVSGTVRYSGTVSVPVPSTDSFIVVECGASLSDIAAGVLPGGDFAKIYPDVEPIAFTNPFFVDGDGDGSWH
ncbi:MAG: hypothetical protein GXO69_05360 [Acidobacteria bacterium]|nr:hypothetical protein [Acidobacteriota bacterium]